MNILHFENFSILLQKKCDLKNIQFVGVESFFDPVMMETVKRTWKQWLGNLVYDLPECSLVISELRMKLESLLVNKESDFCTGIFSS